MDFRIADTFTDSLAKLTGEEQKAAKMAAFDVQLNPAHPGLQSHKLDKPKTLIFGQSLSAGTFVSSCIVPAPACCCAMCITMKAYQGAEHRRLETHPKTGAGQLVEVRERVQEITIPKYVGSEQSTPKRKAFYNISNGTLLSYGVPLEWVKTTCWRERSLTQSDTLLARRIKL